MIRAPCRLRSGLVQLLLRELLHRDLRRQRHQLGGLRPKVLELRRVRRRLGLVLLLRLVVLIVVVFLPPQIVLVLALEQLRLRLRRAVRRAPRNRRLLLRHRQLGLRHLVIVVFELVPLHGPLPRGHMQQPPGGVRRRLAVSHPPPRLLLLALHHLGLRLRHLRAAQNVRHARALFVCDESSDADRARFERSKQGRQPKPEVWGISCCLFWVLVFFGSVFVPVLGTWLWAPFLMIIPFCIDDCCEYSGLLSTVQGGDRLS